MKDYGTFGPLFGPLIEIERANGPYTVKEVCNKLQVSEATLKRRIREGKLRTYKNLGKLMITKSDLDHFIEEYPKYKPKKKKMSSTDEPSKAKDLDILNTLIGNTVSSTVLDKQLYDTDFSNALTIRSQNVEMVKDLKTQRELCLKLIPIYQQQAEALSIQISQLNAIFNIIHLGYDITQSFLGEKTDEIEKLDNSKKLDYINACNECLIKRFLIQEKIRLLNFVLHDYHLSEEDENASCDKAK